MNFYQTHSMGQNSSSCVRQSWLAIAKNVPVRASHDWFCGPESTSGIVHPLGSESLSISSLLICETQIDFTVNCQQKVCTDMPHMRDHWSDLLFTIQIQISSILFCLF